MYALRTGTDYLSDLKHFDSSCTIEFIILNIITNYSSLLNVEKCFDYFHIKKRKNVTISVKLPTENLDFLNDALSSMALQSPKVSKL